MGGTRNIGGRALRVVITLGMIASLSVIATQSQASAAPSVVRLHLGSDFRAFTFGATTQTITTNRNSCVINAAETVIDLSSTGTQSAPGLVTDGIGVKGSPSSGNGSPCSQTDATESLTLRPGSGITGRTFKEVQLDLEMAGNAVVLLTLSRGAVTNTYRLQTGTSIAAAQTSEPDYDLTPPYLVTSNDTDNVDACAAPNSSGPNSAGNDNCRWIVTPTFNFDTVRITTQLGTVALEGSGDFLNNPAFDTVFVLSNAAPNAVPDVVNTNEDTAVTFNVLANDTDGDGEALTVTGATTPQHGTLVPGATSGTYTYTPASNYFGGDSFSYTISDGTDTATATVSITVASVNDRPVALSPTVSTPEDTPITVPVATDVDSTALTASCTIVGGGTVTDLGNGSITYTPPANFNGSVSVTCTITDNQGATSVSSAVVTVGVSPVNDPPVAVPDVADVDENSSVSIAVVANDTDVDGDALVVSAVTSPAHGTAVAAGGSILYTPTAAYVGPDSFSYTVSDGNGGFDTDTVTVTVFQVICSGETVSTADGAVEGSFQRLTDNQDCKRYVLEANAGPGEVLFTPDGAAQVNYRGFLNLGPKPAPSGPGALSLLLQYDPTGGTSFQPVRWCIDPQFDITGAVTAIGQMPAGETWCIASETTQGAPAGQVETVWQVFGVDDPRFK